MYKKLLFVSILIIGHIAPIISSRPELHTLKDFEAIESRLQREAIISVSSFTKQGELQPSRILQVITLESGIMAIFKTGEYHYAEVAAYRLSKLLNILLVPPTIFRTIDGIQGSLQLYIPTTDLASTQGSTKILKQIDSKTLSDIKLFYYIAGQWDTHNGNQLVEKVDKSYRLWLIDNSSILHRSYSMYGGVTYVEKGTNYAVPSDMSEEFPFHDSHTIEGGKVFTVFKHYITSQKHLQSLAQRSTLTYIVWHHTLWILRDFERYSNIVRYTNIYRKSTLDACQLITYKKLASVWAEWLLVDNASANELIKLILARRDEVLKASLLPGTVIFS